VRPRPCSIYVENDQGDLLISAAPFRELAATVIQGEGASADEFGLYFVDEERIAALHRDHFGDPTPTDCISFPIDTSPSEEYRILGEVVVCPKVAIEYVRVHGGSAYQEVALYVVHGLLHLLGYDDLSEEDAKKMRSAESKYTGAIQRCAACLEGSM
jgi:probable rRNA maturation factor